MEKLGNPRPLHILVADDHEVMRMGMRNLLESVPDWSICAEATSGRQAVQLALAHAPDIIIMDIAMPEMNGLEAAMHIGIERPEIPIIVFSLHLSNNVVSRFKTGNVRGVVSKNDAARDLVQAVREVLAGHTFFPSGRDGSSQTEERE